MAEIISLISGGVPGGALLLLFFLFTVNLSLHFLAASKLMDKKLKTRRQLVYSAVILLIYGLLWIQFRPPLPRERIVILPTVSADGKIHLNGRAFRLPESIQQQSLNNLTSRYIMHRWQWLLEAMAEDSLQNPQAWKTLARKMRPLLLVESRIQGNKLQYRFLDRNEKAATAWYVEEDTLVYTHLLENMNEKFEVFRRIREVVVPMNRIIQAQSYLILRRYEKALAVLHGLDEPEARILRAEVYFKKGLKIKIDREKSKYVKINNPEFDRAKRILQGLVKNRQDNTRVAYLLGRIAVQEEKFGMAEVFLKKALIDDPTDSRVYYALSFLLPVRLEDLGYGKRTDVLKKSLYYDPAYRQAAYELANEYYLSGTGTQTGKGTTLAIQTINNYLKIRRGDPQIMSLLGILYIKTERLDEAQVPGLVLHQIPRCASQPVMVVVDQLQKDIVVNPTKLPRAATRVLDKGA